ncbi:MAG: ABC transporter ATP-binding protein [Spirochaetales bacterium]|nr:ABC transporter ATP-binding protein [Spirochaetales bacterium]
MNSPVCEIKNLHIEYPIAIGTVRAVEDASLNLYPGKVLGLVGESGCGKSTLGLSLLNLVRPPGKVSKGSIIYKGQDILTLPGKKLLKLRGRNISMIFQNPLTSLNPLMKIKDQFYDTMIHHEPGLKKEAAMKRIEELVELLGIEKKRIHEFPHQLSGGMRQRIMIGLALIMKPDILIADEPTTSLDVIVEAGFIELLNQLRQTYNLSVMLISHNLGLVAEIAERVAVMYGGKIVEEGSAESIYSNPLHPYTLGLIQCIPNIKLENQHLFTMPGSPPDLVHPPPGCRFSPRCPKVMAQCRKELPPLIRKNEQKVACWLYRENR